MNVVAPMGSNPADIRNLGAAHFNVLMYPETGESACRFLEKNLDQPYTKTVPIGVGALSQFVSEIEEVTGLRICKIKLNQDCLGTLPQSIVHI